MEVAGKVTGILVFVAGVVLLGLVFTYTVRTIEGAEQAVRQGDLVLEPLFGSREPLRAAARPQLEPPAGAYPRGDERAAEAGRPGQGEGPSPMVLFAMALGARTIGLCVLGFLAGVIATQGARLAGASRSLHGRESIE